MKASQSAGRCVRRVITDSKSPCLHVNQLRQSSPAHQPSSRSLSTTARRSQDKPAPQPISVTHNADRAQELDIPAVTSRGDAQRSSQRPTQYQSRAQRAYANPGPADRIDLSTLPGVKEANPDYKPPPRKPVSSDQAAAKLKDLINRNASNATINAQLSQLSPNPFRRTNSPSTTTSTGDDATVDDLGYLRPRPLSSSFNTTGNLDAYSRSRTRSTFNANNLLDNLSFTSSVGTLTSRQIPLRLRPTLGRTVSVAPQHGFDLSRAFRALDAKCSTNNVRRDERAQKFHVRRGQKKKLKRSERWRVLFKKGFLNEVGRIQRMKAQGW